MKYLLLLFLVGLASAASIYDVSHNIDDETVEELLVASHFSDVLHSYDFELADEGGDDKESEIQNKVKKHIEDLVNKIKDALDNGEDLKEVLLEKFKELREKLKELKGRLPEKVKEVLQKIKEKIREYLKNLLEKLGLKDKEKRWTSGLKEMFRKLKDAILKKLDKEALKEKIEKIFGKGSELAEWLLEHLKEKKQKILDFIDRILGDDESRDERSLKELWEKVKDYFKNLGIEIKEKFIKLGEWVKENVKNRLENVKDKTQKIKEIAKELIDHTKGLSKEVAAEALEFLRPYKEDLGALWDQLKDAMKEVMGRNY